MIGFDLTYFLAGFGIGAVLGLLFLGVRRGR